MRARSRVRIPTCESPGRVRTFVCALLLVSVLAGCGGSDPAERLADHYERAEPVEEAPGVGLEEAARIQARFVARIQGEKSRIAGYKAGLTSASVQETFGTDHPVRGTLLSEMLLRSGSSLSATFGARPRAEGDLMVRVGAGAINEAETDSALLAGLDAVVPFLELPDLVYGQGVAIDGAALVAVNVGARRGVVGPATPLPGGEAGYELLGDIRVEVRDRTDSVLTEGRSGDLMGHPLEVVRWVRNSLRAEDLRLEPGMLISLGSVTELVPVEAGQTLTAHYHGVGPDTVRVSVSFE